MFRALQPMPLIFRAFSCEPLECARPTYPIELASFSIPICTSPSEVSWSTLPAWVAPPSTDCWKNVYWPAAELRPIGSIVVDRLEPGTWFQLVSTPRKTFFSTPSVMLLIQVAELTPMHSPARDRLTQE